MKPIRFSEKTPTEIVLLEFDFSLLTTVIFSATITVIRVSGNADASPSSLLSGLPVLIGGKVQQLVTGGISGTDYGITCSIKTLPASGQTLELSSVLPVRVIKFI